MIDRNSESSISVLIITVSDKISTCARTVLLPLPRLPLGVIQRAGFAYIKAIQLRASAHNTECLQLGADYDGGLSHMQ